MLEVTRDEFEIGYGWKKGQCCFVLCVQRQMFMTQGDDSLYIILLQWNIVFPSEYHISPKISINWREFRETTTKMIRESRSLRGLTTKETLKSKIETTEYGTMITVYHC